MKLLVSIAAIAALAAAPAVADDSPYLDKDEAAKRLFEEADALYKAGKFRGAIVKLEESYRLSRNVFLLYNIGHAYDQSGDKPKAKAFYLKFLELAPVTAPMRDESARRVEGLTQANVQPDLAVTEGLLDEPVDIKPVSRYLADFHHSPVETVAPGKAIDISAGASRVANWVVTLFYRATTDETYSNAPMTWRTGQDILVGQIPAAKSTGTAIYYYLEVKEADGTLVTRSGRRTSPHVVKVEATAVITRPISDNPLLRTDTPPVRPPRRLTPVYVSTAAAVVFVSAAITTYLADQNRLFRVTLGASVVSIGVAGYFWYRARF